MPAMIVINGLGMWLLLNTVLGWFNHHLRTKRTLHYAVSSLTLVIICIAYAMQLGYFWIFYTTLYPKLYGSEWQVGYQTIISQVAEYQRTHPGTPIFMTREYGRPAMYYWFFTKTNPTRVQAQMPLVPKDQSEALAFENIRFIRTISELPADQSGLVVSTEAGFETVSSQKETTIVTYVVEKSGKVNWVLYEI
jgi:hypothetical protein